jgi:hypothetical protein
MDVEKDAGMTLSPDAIALVRIIPQRDARSQVTYSGDE